MWWCLCGRPMDPVVNAEARVQVGWYCLGCGRWEAVVDRDDVDEDEIGGDEDAGGGAEGDTNPGPVG